ncbi:hypothetical protein CgunFtcFv8_006521 [Champsocephalus gunnari]|uniref:Uncharacterized protein n=1 Tax=Champsocephalus gunnari TaxID=52237 RepID=A0AAN8C0L6_CHAGU|nr:hypothetical protein CgunFtcFv8_006521 [Champsocephalus gunnari]
MVSTHKNMHTLTFASAFAHPVITAQRPAGSCSNRPPLPRHAHNYRPSLYPPYCLLHICPGPPSLLHRPPPYHAETTLEAQC